MITKANIMCKAPPKIGIIGGAGPMAGLLLMQQIVEICQHQYGCQDDADFPYIMLLSYPFADMLCHPSESNEKLLQNQIQECFSTFEKNNISIVAMACNTLHNFLTEEVLEKAKSFAFIHMIKACGQHINAGATTVLCSNTSARTKLHVQHFSCDYPQEELQNECQRMIDMVLAGKESAKAVEQFTSKLNQSLLSHPASLTQLVLGCTEFSVLNKKYPWHSYGLSPAFSILDSNQVVANEVVQLFYKENPDGSFIKRC